MVEDDSYCYVGYFGVCDGCGYFMVYVVSMVFVGMVLLVCYWVVYVVVGIMMEIDIYVLFIDVCSLIENC